MARQGGPSGLEQARRRAAVGSGVGGMRLSEWLAADRRFVSGRERWQKDKQRRREANGREGGQMEEEGWVRAVRAGSSCSRRVVSGGAGRGWCSWHDAGSGRRQPAGHSKTTACPLEPLEPLRRAARCPKLPRRHPRDPPRPRNHARFTMRARRAFTPSTAHVDTRLLALPCAIAADAPAIPAVRSLLIAPSSTPSSAVVPGIRPPCLFPPLATAALGPAGCGCVPGLHTAEPEPSRALLSTAGRPPANRDQTPPSAPLARRWRQPCRRPSARNRRSHPRHSILRPAKP